MLIHPQFNPAAFELGPLAVRWYALSYIVGFVLFMWLGRRRIRQGNTPFTAEMLDDFLTWGVLGVILGGRLGFVLFYQPEYYFSHPAEIIKVWQGGMSFHGGFFGRGCRQLAVCPQEGLEMDASIGLYRPPLCRSDWLRGVSVILSTANCGGGLLTRRISGQWVSRRRRKSMRTWRKVIRNGRNGCCNTALCRVILRSCTSLL